MKKALLLIASAALLFAGCTKEPKMNAVEEGETVTVTVMTRLENAGPATRASWDNDGNGTKVDHWIMEVYDAQGVLFDRQEKKNQTGLKNSFNVTLIKNQSYKFAFWADTEGAYDAKSLKEVKTVSSVAGLDSRDAFFVERDYTSQKSETIDDVVLKRPMYQINIAALGLDKIFEQMEKAGTQDIFRDYKPVNLELSMLTWNEFNVLTGEVSNQQTTVLSLGECYAGFMAHGTITTIFMDYGFAKPAEDEEVEDLQFSFVSNGVPVKYTFTNIPLQRNHRTNISGYILSNDAKWEVKIDPLWYDPDYKCPWVEE